MRLARLRSRAAGIYLKIELRDTGQRAKFGFGAALRSTTAADLWRVGTGRSGLGLNAVFERWPTRGCGFHTSLILASETYVVRILVVEDKPKLGRLLARGLGEEGHPADLVASGADALWMAPAAPYDVIVLDEMLPGSTASLPASSRAFVGRGRRCSCLPLATRSRFGPKGLIPAPTTTLSSLRDRPFGRNNVETVRGVGYRLCVEETS